MKTLINTLAIMAALTFSVSAQTKYTGGSGDGYASGSTSFTGSGGALPITLLSFSATVVENEVKLTWKTATEVNNDFYTVVRKSTNGSWEQVSTKKGMGNKTGMTVYSLTDANLPANTMQLTYRLLQTDFDGKTTQVAIATVALVKNVAIVSLNLFPNPANGYVNVELGGTEPIQIKLIALDGKEVLSQTISPTDGGTRLDLSGIKAGIYILSSTSNEIKATKLIIQ